MSTGIERYRQLGQITLDVPPGMPRLPGARPVTVLLLVCRDCGTIVVDDLDHDRHHKLAATARAG